MVDNLDVYITPTNHCIKILVGPSIFQLVAWSL